MMYQEVQITWQKRIKIFFRNGWLVRWCSFHRGWGYVANSGEDAWCFITRPDWVCAACRPHREAIRLAPLASLQ